MMAGIFVLVVMSWFAGTGSVGYQFTMQEFNSQQTCEAAAAAVIAHYDGAQKSHIQAWCVPK